MKYVDENKECIICGVRGVDLHHIDARGMGGRKIPNDEPWNLMPIRHQFHQELHLIGFSTFANKYPPVKRWLFKNGWTQVLGRWTR